MTSPLSAALFSVLLASVSPAEGNALQNNTVFPIHEVKNAVERCIAPQECLNINTFHENLEKNLLSFWLSPVLENVLWTFHGSHQELLTIATPIIEQSTHDLQSQVRENKGFFQISKDHWMELWNVANDETREWKERLIAVIRLIAIVNFFTFLPFVYFINVDNVRRGKKTPSILFWGFFISNALGTASLFLAETPLEWVGYWIATIGAAASFFYIRRNEKNNLLDESFMEHMKQHSAFSVYDLTGKMLYASSRLFNILGTTEKQVFAYQKEKWEVVTLFYPDKEEQMRIDAYQSERTEKWQAYEATFFPRRVDNGKKLALHFNTIPRRNPKGEIIGTYRFAEDVTGEQRDNTDLLTGESDKYGFEKNFRDIVLIKKQREIDSGKEQILSVIYSDLDGFKKANDIYSHRNADVVLKEFTQMARKHFRSADTIARLWWDEFWFICDSCNKEMALKKLNILRDELSRTTFEVISGSLVDDGRKVASSREEALRYEKERNLEIKREMETKGLIYDSHIHCCIGGIGVSAGVTDFEYGNNPIKDEDISSIFILLEQQCERVMTWAKKLDVLEIGATTAKNAVGMTILDDKWQVVGARLYSGEREAVFEIDRRGLENESDRIIAAVEVSVAHR